MDISSKHSSVETALDSFPVTNDDHDTRKSSHKNYCKIKWLYSWICAKQVADLSFKPLFSGFMQSETGTATAGY